jgi:DNA-binding MarR family transcriptional regulator
MRTRSTEADRSRPARQISLLFDVFVVNQRLRSLLSRALADSGLRADEYAVYSLLLELGPLTPTDMATDMAMPLTTVLDYIRTMAERGHVSRSPHPRDSRSYRVTLTPAGLDTQSRAGQAWNAAVLPLEAALSMPVDDVRRALHALEDAAGVTLERLLDGTIAEAG